MRVSERWGEAYAATRSCFLVAGLNLAQHRMRMVAGLAGAGVALLLLLLQISFLDAARQKVVLLYDDFDFDLAVVAQNYQFLDSSENFDRVRLLEAAGVAPVKESFVLNIAGGRWTNLATQQRSTTLVIGVDPAAADFVAEPMLRAGLGKLIDSHSVLVDTFSSPDFGDFADGTKARLSDQDIVVAGRFELGLFFYADGGAIVRNAEFPTFSGRPNRLINIGLLRLAAGADPVAAKHQIAASLPHDVRVLTRQELIDQESAFFLSTKPIGIMLETGMLVAACVGAILLFQVLSAESASRMNEYATMKAMGFGPKFVYGVLWAQMAILAVGSALPAALLGGTILWIVRHLTHLPTGLTPLLTFETVAIAMLVSAGCGLGALHRMWRADAADLY
jgi:putative ABC transport system permease protein